MQKTVVITGASRGIGRAAALHFAANGWNLAVCCRQNAALLETLCQKAGALGVSCLSYTGDMGQPEQAARFFSQIWQRFPQIDVLINNAGVSFSGLFQDMTPDQWQQIVSSNLNSVFYCSQQAVRRMLPRQSGCILNVSSVWGNVGASCEVAYSAAKGGVSSLTKALAKELAPSHIRVNAVAFGAIDTDMNAFLNAEERQALIDEIPAGRMGTAKEAAAFLYQLAEAPEYLTGQVITMDGGWI